MGTEDRPDRALMRRTGVGGAWNQSSPLPTGTVTLLLADIEGSSRRWEASPVAMRQATARCEELVAETMSRFGAVRPTDQREGDSFVAACSTATDAVGCALALQRAFLSEPWPDGADLRLRIGLHTGEVQTGDERNYVGPVINRGARLRDIAHGGQVVLSQSTYDMVVDQLHDGMSLLELGTYRLKDLARPERVYQLCHPDLPAEFPRLRSLDVLPNNLPSQVTSFIGREKETAAVRTLLAEHRAVTLTGSGGCGKTRLALQVAAELVSEYPDGVWWVGLGGLTDRAQLDATVAAVLAIRDAPMRPLADTIVAHLAGRSLILVFDNCEHLVDACAELSDHILRGCPSVKLLNSSREPLGVDGEVVFRVPSLSLPVPGDTAAPESLESYEAVRLFVDRARGARPNFHVDEQNATAVVEICRRLDGIPLAIELAAARVRTLTVERIAAGLVDRFRLLTGGSRVAVPRQQTLEASIDWSMGLLNEAQNVLLRRLAVFAGSFALDAAEATCSDEHLASGEVLELVTQLVDRSLVQMDEMDGRYRLLETIRHYAARALAAAGEQTDVRSRHMAYYVSLAESETDRIREGRVDVIRREYDNIRAALECSLEAGNTDVALDATNASWQYWFYFNRGEGAGYLDSALALPGGSPERRAPVAAEASFIHARIFQMPEAIAFADQALELAEEVEDPQAMALALLARGMAETLSGAEMARPYFEKSLALRRQIGIPSLVTDGLAGLAVCEFISGNVRGARCAIEEGLELARVSGNPFHLGTFTAYLSIVAALQGRPAEARGLGEEAITYTSATGDTGNQMFALAAIGLAETLRGNYDEARATLEKCLELNQGSFNPYELSLAELFLGILEAGLGDGAKAGRHFEAAGTVTGALAGATSAITKAGLAVAALLQADTERAESIVESALAAQRQTPSGLGLAVCLPVAAHLARQRGDLEQAEGLGREAVVAAASWDGHVLLVYALSCLGCALVEVGSHAEAVRLFAAAANLSAVNGTNPPGLEAIVGSHRQRASEALGDEEFEAEWSVGSLMTLDQVVATAAKGRGARRRPALGWSSLTPMERQVATLIAEGLTNPQVGEKLFVSPRTVQTHLKHIFAKLGMNSRAHVAAEVARRVPRKQAPR